MDDTVCVALEARRREAMQKLGARITRGGGALARALSASSLSEADYRRTFHLELMGKGVEKLAETAEESSRTRRLEDLFEWAALLTEHERAVAG